MLTKHPGETILYNLICSHVVPEVVTEMGGKPVRTQVGHSIIKQVMAETGAVFGGEHSGHYYYRDNFRADSGIITALLVLELLSQSDQPLSELLEPYKRYADSGEINTEVANPAATVAAIAEHERAGRRHGRPAGRPDRRARRLVVQRPALQHRAPAPPQRRGEDARALRGPRGGGAGADRRQRRRRAPSQD